MAVKTITIDMEAYETLAREKLPGESFSQVIKRVLKPRRMTAASFLRATERITLSDQTLDRIEQIVKNREQDLVSAPRLSGE